MKSIKVKNCRTCPYILYDDGMGFMGAFWMCGKLNIMLIDQDADIRNNLDEIHAQCQLDEYTDTGKLDTGKLISQIREELNGHRRNDT